MHMPRHMPRCIAICMHIEMRVRVFVYSMHTAPTVVYEHVYGHV